MLQAILDLIESIRTAGRRENTKIRIADTFQNILEYIQSLPTGGSTFVEKRSFKTQLPDYLTEGDSNMFKLRETYQDFIELPVEAGGGYGVKLQVQNDDLESEDVMFNYGNSYSAEANVHILPQGSGMIQQTAVQMLLQSNENYAPATETYNIGVGLSQTPSDSLIDNDNLLLVAGITSTWKDGVGSVFHVIDEDGNETTPYLVDNGMTSAEKLVKIDSKFYLCGIFDVQPSLVILNSDYTFNSNNTSQFISLGNGTIKNIKKLTSGKFLVHFSGSTENLVLLNSDYTIDNTFTYVSPLNQINDYMEIDGGIAVIYNGSKLLKIDLTGSIIVAERDLFGNLGAEYRTFNIGQGFSDAVKYLNVDSNGYLLVWTSGTYKGVSNSGLFAIQNDGNNAGLLPDLTTYLSANFADVKGIIKLQDGKHLVFGEYSTGSFQLDPFMVLINTDYTFTQIAIPNLTTFSGNYLVSANGSVESVYQKSNGHLLVHIKVLNSSLQCFTRDIALLDDDYTTWLNAVNTSNTLLYPTGTNQDNPQIGHKWMTELSNGDIAYIVGGDSDYSTSNYRYHLEIVTPVLVVSKVDFLSNITVGGLPYLNDYNFNKLMQYSELKMERQPLSDSLVISVRRPSGLVSNFLKYDNTYSLVGSFTTNLPTNLNNPNFAKYAVFVNPLNDKIYVSWYNGSTNISERLNVDGTIDNTFSSFTDNEIGQIDFTNNRIFQTLNNQIVIRDLNGIQIDTLEYASVLISTYYTHQNNVKIMPDGSYYVYGNFISSNTGLDGIQATFNRLIRYKADGRLDTIGSDGFGGGGTWGMEKQSNGKIIAYCVNGGGGGLSMPLVVSFNTDLTRDDAFNINLSMKLVSLYMKELKVLTDGKIVICNAYVNSGNYKPILLNSNGSLNIVYQIAFTQATGMFVNATQTKAFFNNTANSAPHSLNEFNINSGTIVNEILLPEMLTSPPIRYKTVLQDSLDRTYILGYFNTYETVTYNRVLRLTDTWGNDTVSSTSPVQSKTFSQTYLKTEVHENSTTSIGLVTDEINIFLKVAETLETVPEYIAMEMEIVEGVGGYETVNGNYGS